MLFHVSGMSNASNNNFSKTNFIKTAVIDNSWTLVKSENGINVSVSEYEGVDGALKLRLKFENTSSTSISLKWELTTTNSGDFNQTYNIDIKANSSIEFLDNNNPISINVGQTKEDFTINFK